MNKINVNWLRCKNKQWCRLLNLKLNSIKPDKLFGVYIIWQYRPFIKEKRAIKVGQGNIVERLSKHRNNEKIIKYAKSPNILYVTWAKVSKFKVDGVETYLGHKLKPIIGERYPDCEEIEVNLPWKTI
jgi:hypothetical protein